MQQYSLFEPPGIVKAGDKQRWGSLYGSAASLITANCAKQAKGGITLYICNDTSQALQLEQELRFFCPELPVLLFPDWETLPYDSFSPHQDIISDRLTTLSRLRDMQEGVLVVPVTSLMHRLLPKNYLLAHSLQLTSGDQFDIGAMRERLEASGYRCVTTVYEHGEYAARGSIMDIFPMGSRHPFRIDLLDDEIDTLRTFDPETQRTVDKVEAISLLPGREFPLDDGGIKRFKDSWHAHFDIDHRQCPLYQDVSQGIAPAGIEYYLPLFFASTSTLFDYLPTECLILCNEGLESAADQFWRDVHSRYEERCYDVQRPLLEPKHLFIASNDLFASLKNYPRAVLHREALDEQAANRNFDSSPPAFIAIDSQADKPLEALDQMIKAQPGRTLICAESAGRRESMLELLGREGIKPEVLPSWSAFLASDSKLAITIAPLASGITTPELQLIAEPQIFGQRVMQSRRRRRSTQDNSDALIKNLTELRLGAPVVHLDHGVGRYRGLQEIEVEGESSEFLVLEYADGAKLYVPVSSLHLISRYSGADEELAPLHRLGSDQWSKAKRKAAEKIRDVAAELLNIYAQRAARPGQRFEHPGQAYEQFAAGFPFEETPDQETAIAAVLEDLQAETATDRLVCGDVGFGKTEVAMRAAFMAVHNSKQVAVLVPTTLLAQQHYESFKDRFADWPVTIEVLSRFKTAKEQEQVLDKLAGGEIDILIGTHKLLQKDVQYKRLGLLIIDEEHRFGVRQKEQLKALRAEVDILTLTATPIPRTLNMAMSGMRDLSIIATPPARRLSVKTFVRPSESALIKEAILREILRGGQVYLHNEVKSIEKTARELEQLVPEIRVGIGHGQMRERQLEQVMSDFYHKRYNVLVCTTIIETGIDVPSANTIIIDRADKFGLAQLHQLRGRVGRSHHQAYAYLLTPDKKQLTADAEKRLEAISQAEDLGSGFTLATHDLEIRGAGELLGEDQSGQIHNIGFTLYMEMLERAVKSIREGKAANIEEAMEDSGSEVNLRLPALIPDDYLPDVHTRLILYKRIANAADNDELRELQVEMIDRFGLLPDAVKNLFRATQIKLLAQSVGITKVEASAKGGKLSFAEQTQVEPIALVQLVQSQPATYKLAGATSLRFEEELLDVESRFMFVEELIQALMPTGTQQAKVS